MQLYPWLTNQFRRSGARAAIEYSLFALLVIAGMIVNLRSVGTDLPAIFANVASTLHQ